MEEGTTGFQMSSPESLSAYTQLLVNCFFYAAFTFHVLEWLTYFSDEVAYVWRRPWSSFVKWQYLLTRYGGLLIQASNVAFFTYLEALPTISRMICTRWHFYQLLSGQLLWSLLESSLVHRIYALYNKNAFVLALCILLVAAEMSIIVVFGIKSIAKAEVFGACITRRTPFYVTYLAASTLTVQAIFFTMIIWKTRNVLFAPIPYRVFRDGSIIFVAMLGVLIAIISNNFLSYKFNTAIVYQCSYPILIAVTTSANCHIIRNMSLLPDTSYEDSAGQFTSFFLTDDNG